MREPLSDCSFFNAMSPEKRAEIYEQVANAHEEEIEMKVVYETEPGRYLVESEVPISTFDAGQQYEWYPVRHFDWLAGARDYAQQVAEETGCAARVVDTRPEGE